MSPNVDMAALMGLLQGLQSGDAASLVEAVSASQSEVPLSDEQKAMLGALLSQVAAHNSSTTAADAIDDPVIVEQLQRELADLREVNDTVAAALGACPVCWGGDAGCDACDGDGSPGNAFLPEPRLFSELVAPAVRRVRSEAARRRTRRGARNRFPNRRVM